MQGTAGESSNAPVSPQIIVSRSSSPSLHDTEPAERANQIDEPVPYTAVSDETTTTGTPTVSTCAGGFEVSKDCLLDLTHQNSGPYTLREKLNEKFQKSAYGGGIFLAKSDLDKILSIDNVKEHFQSQCRPRKILGCLFWGTTPQYTASEISDIAEYICGPASAQGTGTALSQTAMSIFATLVLCSKPHHIFDFRSQQLHDGHLPFVKCNERGVSFGLAKKTAKETPLQCFREWAVQDIRFFERMQWSMKPPFFEERGPDYELDEETLPWTEQEEISVGQFSTVNRITIHPSHHGFSFSSESSQIFALKTTKDSVWYEREVAALRKIKQRPNLVSLLTTFSTTVSQNKNYHLLFQWADGGNLDDLWHKLHPADPEAKDWMVWMAEQCYGLADGLSRIHDTRLTLKEVQESDRYFVAPSESSTDEKVCGRHGDIKPPNILWFSQETKGTILDRGHGVLKISDFGLTTFESIYQTKVPSTGIPVSQIYMAPEYEIGENKRISRPYDIWSLGCVYLEFVTWMLLGKQGLDAFVADRENEQDDMTRFRRASFSNLHHQGPTERYTKATVKKTVHNASIPEI